MWLFFKLGRYLIAVMIGSAIAAGSASGAEIIIVIDGSGSSAGQIDGDAKIDIARLALRTMLADAPDNLSIGLVAYGHRQREACDDVELLAPPGPTEIFLTAVAGVRSLGRSPIAAATEAAADAASDPSAPVTIIVITDNADNCSANPCATISALKDRMPNLTISVVGIAIPADEIAEIACFAELTGGLYLRAENAAAFAANLEEALVVAWGDPIPPPPPMPNAVIVFPNSVVQGTIFSVDYRGPLVPGDEIRIAWVGTPANHFISAVFVLTDGTPILLTAPAERGAFELRYWHGERATVLARIPLQVGALVRTLVAPETVQQGGAFIVAWRAATRGGETIQMAEPLAGLEAAIFGVAVVRDEPTVVLSAPALPGTYEIRLVAAPADADGPPEIRRGDQARILARRVIEVLPANVRMNVVAPIIAGLDFSVVWTGPGGSGDEIHLARPDIQPGESLASARPLGVAVTFTAPFPAGDYELRYWSAVLQEVIASQAIVVTMPEASLEAPVEIEGGATMKVVWTGPGAIGDRIAMLLFGDDSKTAVITVRLPLAREPVVLEAPVVPGTYQLAYLTGGGEVTLAQRPIVVIASMVTLAAPASVTAGDDIEVAWEGPDGRFDELRLARPDSGTLDATRIVEGATARLTAPDEPGGYVIQYWAGSANVVLASIIINVVCAECAEAAPDSAAGELRLDPSP